MLPEVCPLFIQFFKLVNYLILATHRNVSFIADFHHFFNSSSCYLSLVLSHGKVQIAKLTQYFAIWGKNIIRKFCKWLIRQIQRCLTSCVDLWNNTITTTIDEYLSCVGSLRSFLFKKIIALIFIRFCNFEINDLFINYVPSLQLI